MKHEKSLGLVLVHIPMVKYFKQSHMTYSNLSKVQMLQVNQSTLDQYGAVSEEVAKEMVEGALNNSKCRKALPCILVF